MMAYNPPYYPRLVENYGFARPRICTLLRRQEYAAGEQRKAWTVSEQIVERFNVRVRPMDRSRFVEDVEAFIDIYNRSLTGTGASRPCRTPRSGTWPRPSLAPGPRVGRRG